MDARAVRGDLALCMVVYVPATRNMAQARAAPVKARARRIECIVRHGYV
jgi:hypothetical protein